MGSIRYLLFAAALLSALPAVSASETDPEPVLASTAAAENPEPESRKTADEAPVPTINELRRQRGLVDIKHIFVPAGQWIFGGSASYSTHVNNDYTFLIIEGIESDGYTFKITPMIGYALRDNSAVGVRLIYSRTLLKVDGGEFSFGDEESGTHIAADYYYSLKHSYSAAVFWRQYIPLGRNKRFALFNEISLQLGGHQTKFAADTPIRGTYETGTSIALGVSPGLIAFATNTVALELNIGVMGISYTHSHQVKNQVNTADIRSSNMNFRINPLSVGLGVSFHL